MPKLGLIGYPLGHSFSPSYFKGKFEREGISDWEYKAYPLENIADFPTLWTAMPELLGLNVTIPHKQAVIPFLDELDATSADIGAVNTVKRLPNGRFRGYNTDAYGFAESLRELLAGQSVDAALVLGTGGASRAVGYVLNAMGISHKMVSRSPKEGQLGYTQLNEETLGNHHLIINTTPLGTYPNTDACPDIPYNCLTDVHFLYDLVYNPAKTLFLEKGILQGAKTINGLRMLHLQAECAWDIWTG